MTIRSGDPDDGFWRRPTAPPTSGLGAPATGPEPPAVAGPGRSAAAPYSGPPPSSAPPPGWRPPVHVQPPPPRALPAQDLPGLDAAEGSARTLTYGVGVLAGALALVISCLLCSRLLF